MTPRLATRKTATKTATKTASKKTNKTKTTKTNTAKTLGKTSKKHAKKKVNTSTVKRRRVIKPTFIEKMMFGLLTRMGVVFKFQQPIRRPNYRRKYYYADFALLEYSVVIECDGAAYHSTPLQKRRDQKRQQEIESMGWYVIRFTGSEIVTNILGCEQALKELINTLPKGG